VPRRRPGCARRPRPSRPLPGHRIAIDARAAARPELGGVERWARELATRLPELGDYEVLKPRPRLVHRAGHAWEQLLPVRAANARALLCPANLAPLVHPRNVIVLHDAAALRHPEWYSPAYAAWQRRILPALARRALHVVTVSEFSRRELVELLGIPGERITVVPGGVDERFSPRADAAAATTQLGLTRPYVLCVASHTARKNLQALVPLAKHVDVVVAGGHRPQFAREEGLDALRHLGAVPERLLPGLYAGAEAFALPSLYEGFGLPVLEAMACGTPVVASDLTALPDTAGGAARLAPPDEVAAATRDLLDDEAEKERLREAGLRRAKEFTWARTAREMHALLEAVVCARVIRAADPRVRDQGGKRPRLPDRRVDRMPHRLVVPGVERLDPPAELCTDGVQPLGIAVDQRQPGAACGEPRSDRAPDAGGGARDDHVPSLQRIHGTPLSLFAQKTCPAGP